jgi:hypothetical protein
MPSPRSGAPALLRWYRITSRQKRAQLLSVDRADTADHPGPARLFDAIDLLLLQFDPSDAVTPRLGRRRCCITRRAFRNAPRGFRLSPRTCECEQFLASFQCFRILSPRNCELEQWTSPVFTFSSYEHREDKPRIHATRNERSAAPNRGVVRPCSRAEAFLRMIFVNFSQSWHGRSPLKARVKLPTHDAFRFK